MRSSSSCTARAVVVALQAVDVAQRVEQELRLDARLHRLQPRLLHLAASRARARARRRARARSALRRALAIAIAGGDEAADERLSGSMLAMREPGATCPWSTRTVPSRGSAPGVRNSVSPEDGRADRRDGVRRGTDRRVPRDSASAIASPGTRRNSGSTLSPMKCCRSCAASSEPWPSQKPSALAPPQATPSMAATMKYAGTSASHAERHRRASLRKGASVSAGAVMIARRACAERQFALRSGQARS